MWPWSPWNWKNLSDSCAIACDSSPWLIKPLCSPLSQLAPRLGGNGHPYTGAHDDSLVQLPQAPMRGRLPHSHPLPRHLSQRKRWYSRVDRTSEMELLLPMNDSPARPGSPRGPMGRTQSWGSPLSTICQHGAELRMGGAGLSQVWVGPECWLGTRNTPGRNGGSGAGWYFGYSLDIWLSCWTVT